MSAIDELLDPVPMPHLVEVKQRFPTERVESVEQEIQRCVSKYAAAAGLNGVRRVAIAVGSRGVADLPLIVRSVVGKLQHLGLDPFIVPAMGSHGGATAAGQQRILEEMGVSEERVGAPIRSSMETVQITTTASGLPVYLDRLAHEADGIVVINRIHPHVSFRGSYESGLMKMIAVGLGNLKGAGVCHDLGFGVMHRSVPEIAGACMANSNILFGIAVLENAYHQVCRIELIPGTEIAKREPLLLEEARQLEPRIHFDAMDVLVMDEIGKNISGAGFDTNIIGRYGTPYVSGGPSITKMSILGVTDVSHGNCTGLGLADFTTQKVFETFSFEKTYPNSLTSTVQASIKIPMVLKNDRQAVQAAIKTCNIQDKRAVRLVWIKNTLEIDTIKISESLLDEARCNQNLEIVGTAFEVPFDGQGNVCWHKE